MGAVAVGAAAAGTGLATYGAYKQGLAQKKYYDYMAGQDRTQATEELQAGDIESHDIQDTASLRMRQLRDEQATLEGSQTAQVGANNLGPSAGVGDIMTDTARKARLDQMMVQYNADKASYAARYNAAQRAWNLNMKAGQDEAAGEAEANAGKLSAFTNFLGGASQIAGGISKLRATAPSSQRFATLSGGRRVPVGTGVY